MNQTPEQQARDNIDRMLEQAGWQVQDMARVNWGAGPGIAIREYPTGSGPADYVLFVDRTPVGIIEAKREEEGHHLTVVEEQSAAYAASKLKWVAQNQPLPFMYESTGVLTRFTDTRDPATPFPPGVCLSSPGNLSQLAQRITKFAEPFPESAGTQFCWTAWVPD